MRNYTVVLKGRSTRDALGDTGRDQVVVEGWDKGEAWQAAEAYIRKPRVLGGVRCDEIEIVSIHR